jgi:hypothetical protein
MSDRLEADMNTLRGDVLPAGRSYGSGIGNDRTLYRHGVGAQPADSDRPNNYAECHGLCYPRYSAFLLPYLRAK